MIRNHNEFDGGVHSIINRMEEIDAEISNQWNGVIDLLAASKSCALSALAQERKQLSERLIEIERQKED